MASHKLFLTSERSSQDPVCTQLKQLRKETWKIFRFERGSIPWLLQCWCSALPTELSSQLGTDHMETWSWVRSPFKHVMPCIACHEERQKLENSYVSCLYTFVVIISFLSLAVKHFQSYSVFGNFLWYMYLINWHQFFMRLSCYLPWISS